MKIEILAAAKQDLQEGFGFYESQKKGLGYYFLESLFSDIESLRLFAGVHGVYRLEDNMIRIYAVLDCRRNPAWARKRLQ